LFGHEKNKKKTADFVRKYKIGSNLDLDDPAYLLREQSIRARSAGHASQVIEAYRTASALLAYIEDRRLTRVVRSADAFFAIVPQS
jgi:hypothetical protein